MAVGLLITTGLLFVNTATLSFYPAFMELKKYPNDLVGGTYVAVINLASLAGVWIGGALSNAVGGRRRSMLLYGAVFTVAAGPLLYLASVGECRSVIDSLQHSSLPGGGNILSAALLPGGELQRAVQGHGGWLHL